MNTETLSIKELDKQRLAVVANALDWLGKAATLAHAEATMLSSIVIERGDRTAIDQIAAIAGRAPSCLTTLRLIAELKDKIDAAREALDDLGCR